MFVTTVLTTVLLTVPASVSATVSAAPATGCPGLDALNPLCQAASALGGIGGSALSTGVDAVLGGLGSWVAGGAEWLLGQIGNVLVSTTTIDLGASWFRTHYGQMTALAAIVVLPLLVVSTIQAVYRQNAGQLLRAFFVQLPLAMLLGVVAVQIVILCLSATDALCAAVAGGSGSNVKALLAGVTKGLLLATADPTTASFVLLLVALLVAVASFTLWLELLVRAAAVYVAVLFLPMALATLVWPSVSHWCRRLVETLTALILSKFVIVATLSLAAGAVASGTAGTGDAGSGFSSVLAGGALLVVASFVPFAILRLIPLAEAGAIGHLEGVRQRSTAAMTRLPRSAAQFAIGKGMEAHGAAKLDALAGPPGIGEEMDYGTEEDCTPENGGLVVGRDGRMIGLPVDVDAFVASKTGPPKPKGPKPILPVPGAGGGGGGAPVGGSASGGTAAGGDAVDHSVPPGFTVIGRPGPNDRRYAMGRDQYGPTIHWLPPLSEVQSQAHPNGGDG
jgi:hypothetical protein